MDALVVFFFIVFFTIILPVAVAGNRRTARKPHDEEVQERPVSSTTASKKHAVAPASRTGSDKAEEKWIEARVEHVIDGDTVIVTAAGRRLKIRLDAIDSPEDGQQWGDIARYGLIKLIGGKTVYLERHGEDIYNRTLATIYVHGKNGSELVNVNERMVTLGHAWVMRKYYSHLPRHRQDKLNRLERWARARNVGLWKNPDPVPPWAWRRSEAVDVQSSY